MKMYKVLLYTAGVGLLAGVFSFSKKRVKTNYPLPWWLNPV